MCEGTILKFGLGGPSTHIKDPKPYSLIVVAESDRRLMIYLEGGDPSRKEY